jgi:hypothetical protein
LLQEEAEIGHDWPILRLCSIPDSVVHFLRITLVEYDSFPMQGETKERWKVLCEQATTEQDPVQLLKIINEINELLMTKEGRLLRDHYPTKPDEKYDTRRLECFGTLPFGSSEIEGFSSGSPNAVIRFFFRGGDGGFAFRASGAKLRSA